VNQSPNPSTLLNQPLASPGVTQPLANEIAKKLVSGENPLDFIKRNIAARAGAEIVPEQFLQAEEEKRAATVAPVEPKTEEPTPSIPPEEPKTEIVEPTVEQTTEVKTEPTEDSPPENSISVNFKNVRKILNETKTQLSSKEQELKRLKDELERYKTGEVVPEVLKEKEAEIARLSKYEKLISLKTSPEYQDKFIKPLSNIQQQLTTIANDYKIPPQKLLSALNIRNQADLNRFLTTHLDDGGFLEVKQLIRQAQGIQDQANEAEKEPASVMEKLIQEGEQARAQRVQQQRESIKTTTRSVWSDAYDEVVKEGKALELIYKDDDPEHNQKFVEPIVKQAASEFGKIINMLVESGLEKLPKDLGHALAKAVMLAHASATSLETRTAAINEAEQLLRNQTRNNRIFRPPVGSSTPGVETVPQEGKRMTPAEAGKSLINSILAKKR